MDETERAYETALTFLEKRDRTEREVIERLTKAGFGETARETAIARLKEYGYVDDANYAARYFEILAAKGRGRLRIAEEMRRKGLDGELVRNTIEDETDAERETARALACAARERERFGRNLTPDEARKAAEKINRTLAARGFSWDVIGDVMKTTRRRLTEWDNEGEDDV